MISNIETQKKDRWTERQGKEEGGWVAPHVPPQTDLEKFVNKTQKQRTHPRFSQTPCTPSKEFENDFESMKKIYVYVGPVFN